MDFGPRLAGELLGTDRNDGDIPIRSRADSVVPMNLQRSEGTVPLTQMDDVLWYVLASSRGGPTRVRILQALDARPRNANQLAEALDLDYTTVRHHLDVLMDNNVLERSGDEYAAVYLCTDQVRTNWDTVERILATVDTEE